MAMALFKLSDKDNSGTIDAREWKRMAKMFGVRAGNVPYKPMNFDEFWRRISSYM
jgi:Ca2+-binding EF-hand superfamily protein